MFTDQLSASSQRQTRTRHDDQRIHEVVPELCKRLYEQRFDRELYWDQGDTLALNRVLAINKNWTVTDVENMVKSYYASDGITLQQAFEWLPKLMKYQYGPLDAQGTPKAELARIYAEVAKRNAEISADVDRRQAEASANDKEAQLQRAIARVQQDLRSRGLEVFKPAGPNNCHLIAMSRSSTRKAQALRIVVRPYGVAPTNDTRYYQALVPDDIKRNPLNSLGSMLPPGQDPDVITYQPPLES
jgi:hypothetical protein